MTKYNLEAWNRKRHLGKLGRQNKVHISVVLSLMFRPQCMACGILVS